MKFPISKQLIVGGCSLWLAGCVIGPIGEVNPKPTPAPMPVAVKVPVTLDNVLGQFWEKRDPIDSISLWRHNDYDLKYINIYIFQRFGGGQPWLQLEVMYESDSWLFAKSITIVADGQRFDKTGMEFQRDVGSGLVYELAESVVTAEDYRMLKAVSVASQATLRIRGDKGDWDYDLNQKDRDMIRDALLAYQKLGGTSLQ